MITKDLGTVTAYAYAVAGGYTGTEEEFTELLGNIAIDLSEIENLSVTITTLPAGSSATASYSNGVLSLGIPKGDKGDKGNTGATGATGATGNGIASVTKTGTSGLVDTYTITFTNGSTTTFTVTNGQDGEVTEAALESTLAAYAKIDGSYDNLTAGNAKQLVSTVRANDKVPYNFRTSGGSVDIGDREYINAITGGSLAWNQMRTDSSETDTKDGITTSYANGKFTITNNSRTTNFLSGSSRAEIANGITQGHKYIVFGYSAKNLTGVGVQYTDANDLMEFAQINSVFYASSVKSSNKAINLRVTRDYDFVTTHPVDDVTEFTLNLIDLTQMFGSTIADYIYSLEQNHAGDGVAWFKKLFPKPYYAYNAGELKHVEGVSSHDMVGFNAWDEEWEVGGIDADTGANISASSTIRSKNYMPIVGGITYYCKIVGFSTSTNFRARFYDADKNYIGYVQKNGSNVTCNSSFVAPDNAVFMRFATPNDYGTTYNHDICINIAWDNSRNGEYEPYELHSYPLDTDLTLRGIPKLDANNSLYYDGDTYESDGTVTRKYGVVDLGTQEWERNTSYVADTAIFIASIYDKKGGNANMVCEKYALAGTSRTALATADKAIAPFNSVDSKAIAIRDDSYSTATAFKTAMDGVYLVYELATPTTETADSYQSPQIVDDFGTEEYVDTRDVAIPVGHDTDYPINILAKVEMAPNSPDGDGDYIVRQTNGENAYVPLVIEDALPTMPSTAGEYRLIVTIADGEDPVLSWEAQE